MSAEATEQPVEAAAPEFKYSSVKLSLAEVDELKWVSMIEGKSQQEAVHEAVVAWIADAHNRDGFKAKAQELTRRLGQ